MKKCKEGGFPNIPPSGSLIVRELECPKSLSKGVVSEGVVSLSEGIEEVEVGCGYRTREPHLVLN